MSCDGDFVRMCVVDNSKEITPDGVPTTWQVVRACDDDPVLGAQTCGLAGEVALCMEEGPDGGVLGPDGPPVSAGDWLRVDVRREASGELALKTDRIYLEGAPVGATVGAVAAVGYAGAKAVDGALVVEPGEGGSTAWLRAAGVDRVALVTPEGVELSAASVAVQKRRGVGVVKSGLVARLPPTLRVLTPDEVRLLPYELRNAGLKVAEPSAARIEVVAKTLQRLELAAASTLGELVFVARPEKEADAGAESDAGAGDAGIEEPEESVAPRTLREGMRLYIDVSRKRLEEASQDASHELEIELIRDFGRAFMEATSESPVATGRSKNVEEFPEWIRELVEAHVTPMLDSAESFRAAWRALHETAVEAELAGHYRERYGADTAAMRENFVEEGFASAGGRDSPEDDFADFLAHAVIAEAWRDGPCEQLRDADIETLPVRRLVPLAKLEVLWGLTLISHDQLASCIGGATVDPRTQGFGVYTPEAAFVAVGDEPEGVRLRLTQGEVHVSGTAEHGAQSAVFDLMHRSTLPGVVRLRRGSGVVLGEDGDQQGATFGMTDEEAVDFAASQGGLLIMKQVSRERIVGHALMVRMSRKMFGTKIFPLVTIRFDSPQWNDAVLTDDDLSEFEF